MMRTDLEFLPERKRLDLEHIVRVLFEEFAESTARARQPWKKAARILKIVLFGSYARGTWVDDTVSGYRSDYDIMIVVNDERVLDKVDYWSVAEERLMQDFLIAKRLSAPVSLAVHTLADINHQLERGRPFFVDVLRQGCALYETAGFGFTTPQKLSRDKALAEVVRYHDEWFKTGNDLLEMAKSGRDKGGLKSAAFVLHQAAERFYHGVLLVTDLYSPKSHNLAFLRSHSEAAAPALIDIWPRDNRVDRRRFELLKNAYINGRYSMHYTIEFDELNWLVERIDHLRLVADNIYDERVKALGIEKASS